MADIGTTACLKYPKLVRACRLNTAKISYSVSRRGGRVPFFRAVLGLAG